jgi:hypothetical protein
MNSLPPFWLPSNWMALIRMEVKLPVVGQVNSGPLPCL